MREIIIGFVKSSMFRFILVGMLNTLVGSLIMFGLYNLFGVSYWVSSATNYVLTSILSFFLNKHFTFKSKDQSLSQLLRFIVNIMACYFLAYGIAKPFIYNLFASEGTAFQDNIAMLAGMIIFTALNYVGQRFFAFKKTYK